MDPILYEEYLYFLQSGKYPSNIANLSNATDRKNKKLSFARKARRFIVRKNSLMIRKGGIRKRVPKSFEAVPIIERIHENLGHLGQKNTQDIISQKYFWDGMTDRVNDFLKRCHKCQFYSKRFSKKAPLKSIKPIK